MPDEVVESSRRPLVPASLPLHLEQRIDALCEKFIQDWQAGQAPQIEKFLEQVPPDARSRLLTELIKEDIDLRRRDGQMPHADEYHRRFPLAAEAVAQAIDQVLAAQSTTAAGGSNDEQAAAGSSSVEQPLPVAIGRYRVIKRLGGGRFGVVYLGFDPELEREVALKIPRPGFASEQDLERFLAEARTAARLDHPGVVWIHEVLREGSAICIVQEYVAGQDLAAWQAAQATLAPAPVIAQMTAEIAEAIGYAHKQGFVHRDLKPANILMDGGGHPRVADFGLALHESARRESAGERSGTPAYMSPEQVRGESHRLDGRSDIWSLGVILYELLTGRKPFEGSSVSEVYDDILHTEPKPPRQIEPQLPAELERICLKCLSKRISDRYTTAADLAHELRHYDDNSIERDRTGTHGEQPATWRPADALTPGIVPKGLRAFDAEDADFFVELLPGPRGRDGLPESLRFWKHRLETTNPDHAFPVGLLYGPSGCGKTSLVKAGLLPRLAWHVVRVYVEATADDTEARLLRSLQRHFRSLPPHLSLREALAGLRARTGQQPGQKVVVVLDQFEQWLHANTSDMQGDLLDALRQCDGARAQCLILVRDDFWMAATRFMHELEVRLVQGQNAAPVELFDLDHATRVLRVFGQAYGRFPTAGSELTKDQQAFLDQAIAGLAQDGKVTCIRLALLAEMLKAKPWTPATLKAIGGAQGVGVAFLEDTFGSATAPAQHRAHQKAVRAILRALLPEAGANIKGHQRSRAELLELSGYGGRPHEFETVLQILYSELRLLTPTDRAGAESEDSPARQAYYQLTHDYLVPSLREWLNRKQKETRRGRAELRLESRSALWNSNPENSHLPSLLEYLRLAFLTRRSNWSQPQRNMMNTAGRVHFFRAVMAAAMLLLSLAAIWEINGRHQADVLVKQLLTADRAQVPEIISTIEPYKRWVIPKLERVYRTAEIGSTGKLYATCALLAVDSSRIESLAQQLVHVSHRDLAFACNYLRSQRDELASSLWSLAQDPTQADFQRFQAACALAQLAPQDKRWQQINRFTAEQLIKLPLVEAAEWREILRPARDCLVDSLVAIQANDPEFEPRRRMASEILRAYDADPTANLFLRLMAADEVEFIRYFDGLSDNPQVAIGLALRELAKSLPESASDNDKHRFDLRRDRSREILARLNHKQVRVPGDVASGVLAELALLPHLESLILDGSNISEDGVAILSKTSNLRQISLANTLVSDSVTEILAQMPQLERIDLSGTRVSAAAVCALLSKLPRCSVFGSVGHHIPTGQILVSRSATDGKWYRVGQTSGVFIGQKLAALPACRPMLELGTGNRLTLLEESAIELERAETDGACRVQVVHGAVLITSKAAGGKACLNLARKTGILEFFEAGSEVAVRVSRWIPAGMDPAAPDAVPVVEIFCVRGKAAWQSNNDAIVELPTHHLYVSLGDGRPRTEGPFATPQWAIPTADSPANRGRGMALEQSIPVERSLNDWFRVQSADSRSENRHISSLWQTALGEFEPVIRELGNPQQSRFWDIDVPVLRRAMARSVDNANKVRGILNRERPTEAKDLYRLLWGYSRQQLLDGADRQLVKFLEHDKIEVRTLAFANLVEITGVIGNYSPEKLVTNSKPAIQGWRERCSTGGIMYYRLPPATPLDTYAPLGPLDQP